MEILENVLSIDKIKHLQELGVNTGNASMTWMLYPYEEGKQPQLSLREWRTFKEPFRKEHCIPAFTLLDIFELLPKEIKTGTDTYWITMYFSDNCWHICYSMSDEFDYYQEFLSYGNDHYFTEPKGIMFFWDENWDNATIISGRYHKATVNELIEHFKIKEE